MHPMHLTQRGNHRPFHVRTAATQSLAYSFGAAARTPAMDPAFYHQPGAVNEQRGKQFLRPTPLRPPGSHARQSTTHPAGTPAPSTRWPPTRCPSAPPWASAATPPPATSPSSSCSCSCRPRTRRPTAVRPPTSRATPPSCRASAPCTARATTARRASPPSAGAAAPAAASRCPATPTRPRRPRGPTTTSTTVRRTAALPAGATW